MIIAVGQIKFMELMSALHNSTDLLVHYFIKELEHTWRVKFQEAKEVINGNKMGVDQMKLIIDMKGMKLKDITNQEMLAVYKQLCLEVQRFFPSMLQKVFILNTPMFFEGAWESQLSQCLDENIVKNKVFISSDESHEDLLAEVNEHELPLEYGGTAECEATCIYSDKGPWNDYENTINYRDPNANKIQSRGGSDDEADTDERNLGNLTIGKY